MTELSPHREQVRNGINGVNGTHHNLRSTNLRDDTENPGIEEECALLRSEKAQLQSRVEELEQLLQALAGQSDDWLEKQKDFESLLEEKSEVIRTLHQKLHQLQEQGVAAAPKVGPPVSDDERAEFEEAKSELEEARGQLRQDEESLMTQMRQMEMALLRDRAELARQKVELLRMHAEFTHEMEQAARDAGLRERLSNLQRLHQENIQRKFTPVPATVSSPPVAPAAANQPAPKPAAARPSTQRNSSGMLRRLFGN